jgi:hypothetical protein
MLLAMLREAQKKCESNAHGAMERLVSFTLQDANEVR